MTAMNKRKIKTYSVLYIWDLLNLVHDEQRFTKINIGRLPASSKRL